MTPGPLLNVGSVPESFKRFATSITMARDTGREMANAVNQVRHQGQEHVAKGPDLSRGRETWTLEAPSPFFHSSGVVYNRNRVITRLH